MVVSHDHTFVEQEVDGLFHMENGVLTAKAVSMLVENSSGKHKGETTISRRDQKRFRYLLFEVAMSLVAKLIRAFYAMLAKGVNYDPKKMMGDSERPAVYL